MDTNPEENQGVPESDREHPGARSFSSEKRPKWYYRTSVLIVALLSFGPLALPLLWKNPGYKASTKVVVTIIVLSLTYIITAVTVKEIREIVSYYNMILQ